MSAPPRAMRSQLQLVSACKMILHVYIPAHDYCLIRLEYQPAQSRAQIFWRAAVQAKKGPSLSLTVIYKKLVSTYRNTLN